MHSLKKTYNTMLLNTLLLAVAVPASAEMMITDYQMVGKQRVSRTDYEYSFRAELTNNGPDMKDVRAVLSAGSSTNIVDGKLEFGQVDADSLAILSNDIFTIRQNRRFPFDPAAMSWEISGDQVLTSAGGVFTGTGGVTAIIPPGSIDDNDDTTIKISSVPASELSKEIPPGFTFLGAASFDIGDTLLADNADIAIPCPDGLPTETDVYVAKAVNYAGSPMYQLIDTAVVDGEQIISQDPAFPGILSSGTYVFLTGNFDWIEGQVIDGESSVGIARAVVTLSGSYWLDTAGENGYYSLPSQPGNFVVVAFDGETGSHGEQPGFLTAGNDVTLDVIIGDVIGPINTALTNGSFESGDFNGWQVSGKGDVISSFGPITPPDGNHMASISNGNGAIEDMSSMLEQSFSIPEGVNRLSIQYNFVSEEFPEYVGSSYNDVFNATLHTPEGSRQVAFEDVNHAEFQTVSGVPCGSGDCTWGQTGWITSEIDVAAWAGTDDTITLTVHDVGDTIFDSVVLLDDIELTTTLNYQIFDIGYLSIPVIDKLTEEFSTKWKEYQWWEGHSSVYGAITELKNGSLLPGGTFKSVEQTALQAANPSGSITFTNIGFRISNWLKTGWSDALNQNEHFNTVYDASPGRWNGGHGRFEVISVTDEYTPFCSTQNPNVYYFSYDWKKISIKDYVDYLKAISDAHGQIERLTIFAHGYSGHIRLVGGIFDAIGTAMLNGSHDIGKQLQRLRTENILSPNADILLFSCHVAKDENFIRNLAMLTQTTVYGNPENTGSATKPNQDWQLQIVYNANGEKVTQPTAE